MADHTKIEWTDATWNPITGCSVVSPGCTNCYAMRLAGTRLKHHPSRNGLTREVNGKHVWTGEVRLNFQWLKQPLTWARPRKIFVCAHGDLFHEGVPNEWIDKVFAIMAMAPQHVFQVLTKRSKRMREYLAPFDLRRASSLGAEVVGLGYDGPLELLPWPLPNVWLGVSAEDQQRYDERSADLRNTAAAVRWFSFEPLLGPIKADWLGDWGVPGGESGPSARPAHPDWIRSLRDQYIGAGVPFLFKQWGEHLSLDQSLPGYGEICGATAVKPGRMKLHYIDTPNQAPKHAFAERGVELASTDDGRLLTFRVGKKAAGRLLDSVEHNEFPQGSDS